MDNTTSSPFSFEFHDPGDIFAIIFCLVTVIFIIAYAIWDFLRSLPDFPFHRRHSRSFSSQDHGGTSLQVLQIVIQRDAGPYAAAISALPAPTSSRSQIKGAAAAAAATSDDSCAICLDEYEDGAAAWRLPRCGHVFHRGCIDQWLRIHSTCPLCRHSTQPPPAAPAAVRNQ